MKLSLEQFGMPRLRVLAICLVPFLGIAGVVAYGAHLERQVAYWDQKIDELCAADGGKNVGLRVYERVMAPESYLRPASGAMPADVVVPWRLNGQPAPDGAPLVYEMVELDVIREKDPRVSRYATRITRVADGIILGEQIKYMRSGGGIPMPDPSEVHICPEDARSRTGSNAIFNEVFLNHPLNVKAVN